MHRSENRGSWEFQPEETLIEDSGEFPSCLAQANLNWQKEDPSGGCAVDVPGLSYQNEDIMSESWKQHRKHVFVLSEAGKPIYSRYGNEEALSSTMGVMMALVSFVQAGGNTIQSIFSDNRTVVFLQKGPLVFVSVSSTRQSEQQLRSELLHVYHQIVSLLTQASINRIFERRKNYDLRRLLFGSEKILDSLLDVMDSDPGFMLSAVQCLPLPSSSRDVLSQILQKAVTPNLVFSFLIANNRLVSIVQEKTVLEDARLKPSDLHLLFNLIRASAFQAGEIWTPICLPLFNHDCYFYAYVAYLDPPECTVCLVLLSTDKEAFYAMAECKRKIEEAFASQNALQCVPNTQMSCFDNIDVANLRHFLYKPSNVQDHHRQLSQFTCPEMDVAYRTQDEKIRLLDLYRNMHNRIHSMSRPLKLIYHSAERETLLAWVTGKFEMYACFTPLITKKSAISELTKLLRWIKKEEDRLFICNLPKYSTVPQPGRSSTDRGRSDRQNASDTGLLSLL
ncbi:vacuolar fusion protein MON1 homolog B [Pimephales promelas]|uniref:vacuolar fusion protein MON1 homolog B n=1 Tax=Pimephales promelas TaxID=90988 RepID=UPI001955A673|nr:vacuolar fusion protein MON1 homolog B [Pimephales promelas]KAG1972127.1 vacuolar fusion protein MON1 B [Pimephales promelas]